MITPSFEPEAITEVFDAAAARATLWLMVRIWRVGERLAERYCAGGICGFLHYCIGAPGRFSQPTGGLMARLNRDEIRAIVIDCVSAIAPEADFDRLKPDRAWREQLEIDSFDFQSLLAAIEARAGVRVPETDYARLALFEEMLDYLEARQS